MRGDRNSINGLKWRRAKKRTRTSCLKNRNEVFTETIFPCKMGLNSTEEKSNKMRNSEHRLFL